MKAVYLQVTRKFNTFLVMRLNAVFLQLWTVPETSIAQKTNNSDAIYVITLKMLGSAHLGKIQ